MKPTSKKRLAAQFFKLAKKAKFLKSRMNELRDENEKLNAELAKSKEVNWSLALGNTIDKMDVDPELLGHKKGESMQLGTVKSLGTIIFKSNRSFNNSQKFSELGNTKKTEIRRTFFSVLLKLLNIFSNGDPIGFLKVLIEKDFTRIFPENYLFKIEGFDSLLNVIKVSYDIQTSREGETQILSLLTHALPSRFIHRILGTDLSSRQISNARISGLTFGPGILQPKKTAKKVSTGKSQNFKTSQYSL